MKQEQLRFRRRRFFSEDFKKSIVKEYDAGEFTVNELGRLHSIQPAVIYRWIENYSLLRKKDAIVIEMKDSSTSKLLEYEKRIKDLERLLGKKEAELDFQKQIINLASDHYKEDLKKNFGSKGS